MSKFITASEAARKLDKPVSQILAGAKAGLFAGAKVGPHANSPLVFNVDDLPVIAAALENKTPVPLASAKCGSPKEVAAKAAAIRRAMKEAA